MAKTHWLYGRGPEKLLTFAKEIEVESDCTTCIHKKVCGRVMEKRCENFEFGTSEHRGCGGCIHKYTRHDKDSVPCFSCPDWAPLAPPEEDVTVDAVVPVGVSYVAVKGRLEWRVWEAYKERLPTLIFGDDCFWIMDPSDHPLTFRVMGEGIAYVVPENERPKLLAFFEAGPPATPEGA